MKIWPFWRFWYFTREQRLAILFMTTLMVLLVVVKGPVYNLIFKRSQEKYLAENKRKWIELKQTAAQSNSKSREDDLKLQNSAGIKQPELHQQKAEKKEAPKIISINKADLAEWKSLRGIGEVLASRIIKYKEKLGGFYSKDQLKEVYGISDSLFRSISPYLKADYLNVRKINPNEAELSALQQHPYISPTLSKQIVSYRSKVKKFETVEDMRALYNMNDSIFQKLKPYISME
jgi:competence ComEA-like helix-hairpin-helix protein